MSSIIFNLIDSYGLYLVWIVLFLEAALLIGVVLPGDSLLIVAGVLMYHKHFHYLAVSINMIAMVICSTLGSYVSFLIGKKFFEFIRQRTEEGKGGGAYQKLIYKASQRTTYYLELYNINYIILIYKFIPLVRTLAPFIMGADQKIDVTKFLGLNLIGSSCWIAFFCNIGFFMSHVLNPEKYLGLLTVVIVIITLLPLVLEFLKKRKTIDKNKA